MRNFDFIDKAQFLDDLFDNSSIAILVVDKNRINMLANNRFCEMFGYKENEILGKNTSIFHKNEMAFNNFGRHAFDSVIKNKPVSIDYEFKKKDGSLFWAKISGDPLKNKKYILWTLIDITENIKMKNDLEAARERLHLGLEGSRDGLWDWNVKTHELYLSPSLKKILGYEDHELVNSFDTWERLVVPKYAKEAYTLLDKYFKNEVDHFDIFFEMYHKDGRLVPILSRAKKVVNEKGETTRVVGTHTDITEIKKFQKEIGEQKKLLQTVIDEIPYPVVLKNYDGKFVLVNKFLAKLYNTTPSDMIGKDDGDYIPDKEIAEKFRQNVKNIMRTGKTKIVYEDSIDVSTNETRNFMSIKKPFENERGEKFILILANDITELNKKNRELNEKERVLFRQSKLASMGEMLANIAHQWRQPLSAISTMATGMIVEKELNVLSDENIKNGLKNINENTQFLSQTIEDFRSFYNPKDNDRKEILISNVIEKVFNIVKGQFYSNSIRVVKDIKECEIKVLESELIQVILNVLNNARDALCQVKDDKLVLITTEVEKNSLYIDIMDSASGIDTKIIDKIFEPYFTTKHKSIGTGIGLYMSEEIIVKHLGGKIEVSNTLFEVENKNYFGAKFRIKLPLN